MTGSQSTFISADMKVGGGLTGVGEVRINGEVGGDARQSGAIGAGAGPHAELGESRPEAREGLKMVLGAQPPGIPQRL